MSTSFIHRTLRPWLWILATLALLLAPPALALAEVPLANEAVGTHNGTPLDTSRASVSLVLRNQAVTMALAEISPNRIVAKTKGVDFSYDLLPTINPGDTSFDLIYLSAPDGFANLAVTGVSLGGSPMTPRCPAASAGEYCATTTDQVMRLALGEKVAASLTRVRIDFRADAPAAAGLGDFLAEVDNAVILAASTGASPTRAAATAGDADGDPGDANTTAVEILPGVDPQRSSVSADPAIVIADGTATSTITTTLRDANGHPVADKEVSLNSDRGGIDTLVQPSEATGEDGVATGTLSSTTVGVARISATVTTDELALPQQPEVYFTQGLLLDLTKTANKKEALVGDVVTYRIELKNTVNQDVIQVRVEDLLPPNFKYLKGSTLVNGQSAADPSGHRPLTFDIGTVPALVDSNGNGEADPGEPGFMTLSYQLVVGSGATPGDYVNRAVAKDVCDQCLISNQDEAKVTVPLDPLFDLGTIIGKVFEDHNEDGWQDPGEDGVAGAMVALDDGTYALTDEYGRYHFPAVKPGQRLIKINLQSLSAAAVATTGETLVLTVTEGLLAKANFGVSYRYDMETIGKAGETGLLINSEAHNEPVQVAGSGKTLQVLINGEMADIPSGNLLLLRENLLEINGAGFTDPVEFQTRVDSPDRVSDWALSIVDARGEPIRTMEGAGTPPDAIGWDGRTEAGALVTGGKIYQYQMTLRYADGSRATSARELFGINQSTAISLNLAGGAFESGSSRLTPEARELLKKTARLLRRFPEEKVIIEGHTDVVGAEDYNLDLSRRRAESAAAYLSRSEKIPQERFVIRWYGESRPIASNEWPEGRALNRRVEIQGAYQDVERASLLDQYRTESEVKINGVAVGLNEEGRFATQITDPDLRQLDIEVGNEQGATVRATLPVPLLEILEPSGEVRLSRQAVGEQYAQLGPAGIGSAGMVKYRLVGRTDPGNTVELNGRVLTPDAEGLFTTELTLNAGPNHLGLVARNPQGYTRIGGLKVTVADREADGRMVILSEAVPNLTVKLPPGGEKLKTPVLTVSGLTDPGNAILVNGQPVAVQPDGRFASVLQLPDGKSLLNIEAIDPKGHRGAIEREVEVSDTRLFLLAFADGKFSQIKVRGNLQNAGVGDESKMVTEGRVALYLKGVIAGRYLITAALDTGQQEVDELFSELDETENDRLLTNLDPDKLYPVYGDASTIVYDTESQGKLYLALDSDDLHLLVGNYALALTDTELAAYQRTLYGGHLVYASPARSKYGEANTQVEVFGAEVHQMHIRDELRSTGGSLYYLSQQDVVEGSEQITLVVRDKNTGLVLARIAQEQNVDYTVKYDEGRILFHRPVASVHQDGRLIDNALLPGNPVFIQIDYETEVDSFEKTAFGGRLRQQLGDHVAVGGTYVQDELSSETYDLWGIDTEVRLGQGTRLLAEYARSSGADSLTFVSDDGGLSYQEGATNGDQNGSAWKASLEVDLGEWFGSPDRYQAGGYYKQLKSGFRSSGNFLEQGTDKYGAHFRLRWSERDKVLGRYDREERDGPDPAAQGSSDTATLQWEHYHGRWGLTTEYQHRTSEDGSGRSLGDNDLAAARLRFDITEDLLTYLEHQQTLSGERNDQTTAGAEYQVTEALALNASGTVGSEGSSAQGGASLAIGQGHLYLTQRLAEMRAGRVSTTVLGGETPYGKNARVYSEYQWERAATGNRNLSLLGAERRWDLLPGLHLLLSGEYSETLAEPERTTRYTVAAGLSYAPKAGVKLSTRNEVRRERGGANRVQYLTTNHLEIKLNPDYSLSGKYRYSITRDRDLDRTEARFTEASLGLAYRPVKHDRFNALVRYTYLTDQQALNLAGDEGEQSKSHVASAEWSLELTRRLEWVDKEAIRIKKEKAGARNAIETTTWLSLHRLNFHLMKKIDLAAEYRMLFQNEADDRREGWLLELTWQAMKHFHLGVGYNFTDFSDNEFSDNDYSVEGWFVRAQGMY